MRACAVKLADGRFLLSMKRRSDKAFVKVFREWLNNVGLDGEAYCTHFMLRGGATELYARGVAIEISATDCPPCSLSVSPL